MIDIYEIKLLNLLPPNLKQDPDIIAASKAVDNEFVLVVNEVKNCIIMPRVDELESTLIDLLAWERHVDFYDSSLPLETRRKLVENSIRWHKKKGTPEAVEELITELFGEGQVEEWYEFGGDPHYFRVVTNNSEVTTEKAQEFIRALNSVKRKSAWLDSVIIIQTEDMPLYFAGAIYTGDYLTIKQVV